ACAAAGRGGAGLPGARGVVAQVLAGRADGARRLAAAGRQRRGCARGGAEGRPHRACARRRRDGRRTQGLGGCEPSGLSSVNNFPLPFSFPLLDRALMGCMLERPLGRIPGMSRTYFGTDGIRGTVGQSPITPDFMLKLGHAVGRVLHDGPSSRRPTVLIGKDTRISGYMIESALEAGFAAAGIDVLLTGPLPTPGV